MSTSVLPTSAGIGGAVRLADGSSGRRERRREARPLTRSVPVNGTAERLQRL